MQVELASGKDLNTIKGPNTQVPGKFPLSKQIVSQLLYKYVLLTQILQALLLGACVGRLNPFYYYYSPVVLSVGPGGGGRGGRVTCLLLGPTKEGRSRRDPALRYGIEFYIMYSHNN